jgi:hypothetical protein
VSKCNTATLDRLPDGIQQHVIAEWLGQELYCTSLHRLHRGRHVAITGDEDDRHVWAIDDAFLEIEAVRLGSATSSIRQLGTSARERARKSSADAKVSGCQPPEITSNSSDSRTETSSSTTNTIGVSREITRALDSLLAWPGELMSPPRAENMAGEARP